MAEHSRIKGGQKRCWPITYRWLAAGTLIAYTAAGSSKLTLANAQDRPPVHGSTAAGQAAPAVRFDIPAGPIGEVSKAFEDLTGIRVRLAHDAMSTIPSPGVSGLHSVATALQQMLAGTGIDYRFTDSRTVTLDVKAVAEAIEVMDHVVGEVSPKYTEPLRDTPQSISVVPQQVIAAQAATTLRDTLRNVAGISIAAGEGGAQGDNLTIRGFTARNDIFQDGMRDFGSYYRDTFDEEEVEVLKGPSSVTFGRGTTGGVINQASKSPNLSRFITGSLDFGSDATRRITADIDTPLSKLGQGAAFRLNLMGNESGVSGRDVAEYRRYGVAPSLALGLGTPTRVTFSYFHESEDDNPDYGIPWLFNGPAPVNRSNYYGFEDGNYLRTSADIGTVKVEHDAGSAITIRNQLRYANYGRDADITEARIVGTPTLSTPLSAIMVNRGQIAVDSTETSLDDQLDMTARFTTGPVRHTFVTGVEAGRETSDPTRPTWSNVPGTSLLNPDESQAFAGTAVVTSKVETTARSLGVYALDTVKLGKKWDLTGGLRWDRFEAQYQQSIAPSAKFSRVDEMPAWRAAVVYKPLPRGSIYFDYGTSFNPSAETLALSAANANLAPEKNRTVEFGTKWEAARSRMSLRAAVYRTDKTNAREPDPNNPILNVLAGNQRVSGAELEASGRVTSRWQVLSSYAYMESKVVSSTYYPATIGLPLANVPRNTFTMWNNYDTPWRLTLGGGGQFMDSRVASTTAPIDPVTGLLKQAPSYWVFNAMARYPLGERVDLQVNAYNLTNRYYYDQIHPAHIVPGAGRSILIGLRFKF